MLKKKFEKNTY